MAETTHFAGKLILKYDTSPALSKQTFCVLGSRLALRCHHESTRSVPKVKHCLSQIRLYIVISTIVMINVAIIQFVIVMISPNIIV